MPSQRAQRVARQLLQEVSQLVERELGDPRLSLVTFTDADISPDLRSARIWYSCLGEQAAKDDAGVALAKAAGYLRRGLSRRLHLRYTPELRFELDESLDRADRISGLIGRALLSHGAGVGEVDADDNDPSEPDEG